ncbi:MAG: outer membrane beta-barrel protein [Mucilaginibacter sp.]|uniref:outer membrane beta-barrel protein n=1 Tax=Mucilaginibacter sp. TaxID=1882438 RepID=UPI0031A16886
MKNSAWYHKLWLKKLDELPVQDDAAAAAWAGMKAALDKTMPPGAPAAGHAAVKPLGAKLVSLFAYVLPAAAMIGGGAYFLQHKAHKQHKPKHKTEQHQLKNNNSIPADSLLTDSLHSDTIQTQKDTDLVQATTQSLTPQTSNSWVDSVQKAKHQPGIGRWVQGVMAMQSNSQASANNIVNGAAQTTMPLNTINKPVMKDAGNNTPAQPEQTDIGGVTQANGAASATLYTGINASLTGGSTGTANNGKPMVNEKANTQINANKTKARNSGKALKASKAPKYRQAGEINVQPYHYGLEVGLNTGSSSSNVYFGGFGSVNLNNRWLVNAGVRFSGKKQLSGTYTHPSFYAPDSLQAFRITDSRKVLALDIPISLEYKASNLISFKAGPVISLGLKQSDASAKISELNRRDSLFFRKTIADTVGFTTVKKLNVGFSGGVSLHIKQFDIDGRYQLMPYKVSSPIGSYRKIYNTFQLGVSYRF